MRHNFERSQTNNIKLILVDYSMPDIDGPTCTKLMRQFMSEEMGLLRKVQPLICILSAYTEQSYMNASLSAGADLYYAKPIFKAQMRILLQNARIH